MQGTTQFNLKKLKQFSRFIKLMVLFFYSLIMGVSNTVATVPGILSPLITGYIVQNKVI